MANNMLRMFRKTTILYYVLATIGIIFIVFGQMSGEMQRLEPNLFYFVFRLLFSLLIWIMFCVFIASLYAKKIQAKIHELYTENCDPVAFTNEYESISNRRIGNLKNYALLNLSTGYLDSGNLDMAIKTLNGIQNNAKKGLKPHDLVFLYNNLCAYYVQIGDLNQAEQALSKLFDSLQNEKLSNQYYDIFYDCYVQKQCVTKMMQGNYDSAEEIFALVFGRKRKKTKLDRVYFSYQTAKIHFHFNRFKDAKELLEYVIDNGNTFHWISTAKELLDQCNNQLK